MRTALLFPLLSCLALCLGACSGEAIDSGFIARANAPLLTSVSGPAGGGQTGSVAALALPGAAGAVAQVRERAYPNGVRQEIALRDEGGRPSANDIELSVATSAMGQRVGWLAIGRPSANGIGSEILARFPNQRMQIVTRPLYNALGRFGLAIGRDPSGTRCVFAWQWIDNLRDADSDRATVRKTMDSLSGRGLPASIRIRLCRRDMTLDQLAALVEGLTPADPETVSRLASLVGSGEAGEGGMVANPGAATSPVPESLESALGPAAAPPSVAHAPSPKKRARRPPDSPDADAEPPQATSRSARRTPAPRAPDAPETQQGSDGTRYLAPVDAAQGSEAAPAQAPVPRVGRSVAGGPNLPPQAFSGPGPGAAQRPVSADPYGGGTPIGAAP